MTAAGRIDSFWARFFGVPVRALHEPGWRVVSHVGLDGYPGVWFFVRESACIVSAPAAWCEPVRAALEERTFDDVLSEDGLVAVFGDALGGTVGPAYQGWLDPERFHPARSSHVRALEASDAGAVAALRAASTQDDWERGDPKLAAPGAFGWFEDGELLAAASLTHWDETTVGPGVLARRDHRRAGCGTAVCSAAVEWALAADLVPTYQTLMANTGALGIARRLGFEQYASHLAVRLTPPG